MESEALRVTRDEAGGCPHLNGLNLLAERSVRDPETYSALAREEAPVFFVPEFGFYVVNRHEDVTRVLTDNDSFHATFPPVEVPEAATELLPNGFAFHSDGILMMMNPPRHTRVRKLAQKAFTRSAVKAWEEPIRTLCNRVVDEFADDGEADLVTAYTSKVPMLVMAEVLGFDPEEAPKIYGWALDFFRLIGDPEIPAEEMMELCHRQADWERWALDLIAERRANPRDEADMLTALINARDDEGGPGLGDNDIFGIVVILIAGGADTASTTVAQMMRRMLGDPPLYQRVRKDPSLLSAFLEEELRHDFVGRLSFRHVAPEGAEIGGVKLPGGATVAANIWSANRDDEAFERPREFDLDRADVGRLLSWGKATHFCLGAPLARLEIPIAVEVLLERLPNLRATSDADLDRVLSIFLPVVTGGLSVRWELA